MRYWVKLWTEMLDDPKMGRLTDRQHRTCTNLFCLAGIIDDDGRLLDTTDIAFKLRRPDIDDLEDDLEALAIVGILEKNGDGIWQLVHFQERNERPPSAERDAIAERVKRHRAKGTTLPITDVTECNEYVTTLQTNVTPLEKIREDKIREEEEKTTTAACAAPAAPSAGKGNGRGKKDAPEPLPPGKSEFAGKFLDLFGATRFKNSTQIEAVLALERAYGEDKVLDVAKWAATKGMRVGDAISAIATAIPGWGKNKSKARAGPQAPEPKAWAGIRAALEEYQGEANDGNVH